MVVYHAFNLVAFVEVVPGAVLECESSWGVEWVVGVESF